MEEIYQFLLSEEFYGNTIGRWLAVVGLIAFSIILSQLFRVVLRKILSRKAGLEKLVQAGEQPLVICLMIGGSWLSVQWLHLNTALHRTLNLGFRFVLALVVTWLIARLFNSLAKSSLLKQSERSNKVLLPFVYKTIHIFIWIMGAILALNNAGYNVGAILAGFGIGGIAVALAAKETAANLIGAITLLIDRPFVVGDNIIFKDYNIIAREIGMRNSIFEIKYAGQLLIVPNADIVNTHIINISREPSRMFEPVFRLDLRTAPEDIDREIKLMDQEIQAHQYTENRTMIWYHIRPDCFEITARFWVSRECKKTCFDYIEVQSQLFSKILVCFRERGIRPALPRQEFVHLDEGKVGEAV